jgi:perosamine synthetase
MTDVPTWPRMGAEECDAAIEWIRSNRMTQLHGPDAVGAFEAALAAYHDVPHAVAVNSGTSAVHLSLAALGIGPGDEVVVPTYTFVASATPVVYQGATPVFVDVRESDYCLDPARVAEAVTPRTRAVVAVHLNGHPAAVTALREICDRHGLALVEDAAQAIGARYGDRSIGAFGVTTCLSFWQDKIITTAGEGGAILTADPGIAARLRQLRSHGETAVDAPRLYHHSILGYNYRLTAPQAAVGTVQVGRLADFVECRRRNAALLSEALSGIAAVRLPGVVGPAVPSWWKYTCVLDPEAGAPAPAEFTEALRRRGVPAQPRYPIPLHRQPVFAPYVDAGRAYPVAERLCARAFSLPVHPAIEERHIAFIADQVRAVAAGSGGR